MSKVKPYIITIQYIGVYSDPPPTEEQILAEVNVDVINVKVEPMIVNGRELLAEIVESVPAPAPTPEVAHSTETIPEAPRTHGKSSKLELKKRNLLPFSTLDLDANGPSVKVLTALYATPLTSAQLRDVTQLKPQQLATALSRLRYKGRVAALSYSPSVGTTYKFVK
jgi:hypothetical protein